MRSCIQDSGLVWGCSNIGLYLRQFIANVVRELSRCMDSATMAAYKEGLRVTKFVLDTESYWLKIEPKANKEDWDLVVYSNSDRAGDTENRIRITVSIIYLLGVPKFWRSKGQKGVTLSRSEAEYGCNVRGSK
jgi:hypothetical protein